MNERIRLTLQPPDLAVDAGGRIETVLTIANDGPTVDQFAVSIEGLPPGWSSVSVESVALFPGTSDSVRLKIHPPRAGETEARAYPFRVIVTSRQNSNDSAAVTGAVTVAPFGGLRFSMQPQRAAGRAGAFNLLLENLSNQPRTVVLSARDPEMTLEYGGLPAGPVTLPPTGSMPVPLSVRARNVAAIGQPVTFRFQIRAEPPGMDWEESEAKVVEGELLFTPRWQRAPWSGWPGWLQKLAMVGLPLLAILVALAGARAAGAPVPGPSIPFLPGGGGGGGGSSSAPVAAIPSSTPAVPVLPVVKTATPPAGAATPPAGGGAGAGAGGGAARPQPPVIDAFGPEVGGPQGMRLTYTVRDAAGPPAVAPRSQPLASSGPLQTSTLNVYDLSATNSVGETKARTEVFVLRPPEFRAQAQAAPAVARKGEAVRLSWQLDGAAKIFVDGKEQPAGAKETEVRPDRSRTYVISARNAAGVSEAAVRVQVEEAGTPTPPPPTLPPVTRTPSATLPATAPPTPQPATATPTPQPATVTATPSPVQTVPPTAPPTAPPPTTVAPTRTVTPPPLTATPTAPPTPPTCTPLTAVDLTAQAFPDAVAAGSAEIPVRLTWRSQGTCSPFQGNIVARYEQETALFATYPANAASGPVETSAPVRTCTQPATHTVRYTIDLGDAQNRRVSNEATIKVQCRVQATPTPAPAPTVKLSINKRAYQIGEVMNVCTFVSAPGAVTVSDTTPDQNVRVIHTRTAPPQNFCFDREPLVAPAGARTLRLELRDQAGRQLAFQTVEYTVATRPDPLPDFTVEQVRVGKGPLGIDIDPQSRDVWVTAYEENKVYVIDRDRKVTEFRPDSESMVGRGPFDIRFSEPDGRFAGVTNNRNVFEDYSDTLYVREVCRQGARGCPSAGFRNYWCTSGLNPRGVATTRLTSPDRTVAFFVLAGTILEGSARARTDPGFLADLVLPPESSSTENCPKPGRVQVGRDPYYVAVAPDNRYTYVTNRMDGTITQINLVTPPSSTPTPLTSPIQVIKAGENPVGIALSPDGKLAYITNTIEGGTVSVIDLTRREVVATIPVGKFPWGIVLNKDGSRAYVAGAGDNTVLVIDTAKRQVIQRVAQGLQDPRMLALDEESKRLWVTNYGGDTVAVIQFR